MLSCIVLSKLVIDWGALLVAPVEYLSCMCMTN
jgi:hypothetical protein